MTSLELAITMPAVHDGIVDLCNHKSCAPGGRRSLTQSRSMLDSINSSTPKSETQGASSQAGRFCLPSRVCVSQTPKIGQAYDGLTVSAS